MTDYLQSLDVRIQQARQLQVDYANELTQIGHIKEESRDALEKLTQMNEELRRLQRDFTNGLVSKDLIIKKKFEKNAFKNAIEFNRVKLKRLKELQQLIRSNDHTLAFLIKQKAEEQIIQQTTLKTKLLLTDTKPSILALRKACYHENLDFIQMGMDILTKYNIICDKNHATVILQILKEKRSFQAVALFHKVLFSILFSSDTSLSRICHIFRVATTSLKQIMIKIPNYEIFVNADAFRVSYQQNKEKLLLALASVPK